MLEHNPDITPSVIFGLGWYYLLLFLLNCGWVKRSYDVDRPVRLFGQDVPVAGFWALYTALLGMVSIAHLTGYHSPEQFLLRMPEWFKTFVDANFANPVAFFVGSVALFVLMIWLREWWTRPTAAWILLNLALLFLGLSMTDYDFRQIVGKPDNVPIVSMLFIVGFFSWIYFARSVDNDRRVAEGRPLREVERQQKVLVWPDLVYTELVCMVVVTVILVAWGILLQAPLEEPASRAKTPNPSKAPWYFLGLQEMLVYYDPWMAGVVLPSIIIVGMMAIPYIDFNKLGNGYYTFNQRKFSVITFMFGFLPLWVAMIVLGTFLRGPNWNFFGPYEYWDVHKLELLNNVNLSEYFWFEWLKTSMPVAPEGSGTLAQVGYILLREWVGLAAVVLYLGVMPMVMAATVFRRFFLRMGFLRYMVLANLMLFMAALPIKMVLRWSVNLKYIVAIPEWFFNI
uniref:Cytochrome b/b6 C-terminal region profile domain-containing protein n=1 Tax=Schlesneria paludicola TaxID=360056 RepID=A0A7C2JWJ4_9PLAN